ncbi:MAG: tetratricopeptide repeat protein [Nitrospirae bacterium]|nr:tetratricopeptide repeat protein [Nitrospirota bacterium]
MKTRCPFFKIGSSGLGIFVRFLGGFLVMVSTVSSGRAETSAISLEQQITQVQSKLALIKTDIIHQYQSNDTVFERPNRSSIRSTHPDSGNVVQGGEAQADGASQSVEANLEEIAVLMKRLETGGDPAGSSNEGGPASTDEMRLRLADRLLRADLLSQAEQTLKDLVIQAHRAPIVAEGWFQLEKLYYRKGDYPQAIGAFLKIPMSKTLPLRPEATYLAGNSYLYLKDYLKAIDLFSKIGEGSDYYPFAVYSSGLAYLNLGDAWSSTQLQFQKLIALKPGEDPILQELINKTRVTLGFIFMDQKRYPEALSVFEAIPPQSRYRIQARFGIGKAFMGMEDCVKAIVVFKDLIEQAPAQSYALEAHLQIGNCYSKLSAYHRAVDSYQDALKAYSERSESFKKLIQQIQTTNLENWLSLAREPGFPEAMNVYADWFRLNKEIADEVQRGRNPALHKTERGTIPDFKPLQMKMQDVRQDMIKLLQASATHHLSSQLAQIDELALRANMGIAKNMTFMQDHETVP